MKLNFQTRSKAEGDLSYEGRVIEERGQMVVILNAKEYDERVFIRFPIPIPTNDATVVGLWLGVDFNCRAMVGSNLLSRIDLNEEMALPKLKEFTEIDSENEILRLKF